MPKQNDAGWKVERCRFGLLERIFAERWIKENRPSPGLNYGYGLLQDLFIRPAPNRSLRRHNGARLVINRRDRMIAATVIQWLGTNVGYGFLTHCLEMAGLRIVAKEDAPDDGYYSRQETTDKGAGPYRLHPSAWQNFIAAAPHVWTRPPVLPDFTLPVEILHPAAERREELRRVVQRRRERIERAAMLAESYFRAYVAAEMANGSDEQEATAKAEAYRLRFDPKSEKFVCEYLRPVPGQRKGLKRPKMETARLEYDEDAVFAMIRGLSGIARGEKPRFACNPDPNAGAFL